MTIEHKNDGGMAFPMSFLKDDRYSAAGMSLRDYFAAKAMEGLLAQSMGTALSSDVTSGADYAYKMADAMLKERNK